MLVVDVDGDELCPAGAGGAPREQPPTEAASAGRRTLAPSARRRSGFTA
jgi:hypothetical protein